MEETKWQVKMNDAPEISNLVYFSVLNNKGELIDNGKY
jgi:hypothetical protein